MMRSLDRSIVASVLIASGVIAAPVIACSSSDPSAGGSSGGVDEGGVVTPGQEGGSGTDGAAPTTPCEKATDCASGVCNLATKLCAAATCTDGAKNGTETDIDCGGGGTCATCGAAKVCKIGGDCASGVCKDTGTGLQCQAPTNTDGVKNGLETGIDCGGAGNPTCADGQGCIAKADCTSSYCKANVCAPVKGDDGVQNGAESDIDCGGEGAKTCDDGKMCFVDGDCTSTVCKNLGDGNGLRCQVPTPTDGKKNGIETDVDCGGAGNPGCGSGKTCVVGGDCTTLGCDYNFKCAIARSCSAHYGGDTCGAGGAGGVGAEDWESCCTTIATPSTAPDAVAIAGKTGKYVYMDKYPTTSGRMRVFLETVGYDVRTAVQTMRAAGQIPKIPSNTSGAVDGVNSSLDESWDLYLPTSFAGSNAAGELADCPQGGTCTRADGECGPSKTCRAGTQQAGIYTSVYNHLGRNIFKNNEQSASGCFAGAPGTHSYRFPDFPDGRDGDPQFDATVYDTKTMSCVDYLMAQAFCAWDGGRLETVQEWLAAWGSNTGVPYADKTALRPVTPSQRCNAGLACTSNANCNTDTPTCNASTGTCCLKDNNAGDKTYWGCRFPWATDASHPSCGLTWPATTTIEWSDYLYSYEYPKLLGGDYIVHLTPPGRTKGRGPLGHSDLIGAGYELAANVNAQPDPLDAKSSWTGNGSWEVHGYQRSSWGSTPLLNKYGKLGMRCVKLAPTN